MQKVQWLLSAFTQNSPSISPNFLDKSRLRKYTVFGIFAKYSTSFQVPPTLQPVRFPGQVPENAPLTDMRGIRSAAKNYSIER